MPSERKTRENTEYNEYKGDDVHDKVFQQVIKQSYSMFRLFAGTFQSHFTGDGDEAQKIEHFKLILQQFFSTVIIIDWAIVMMSPLAPFTNLEHYFAALGDNEIASL